MNVLGEILKWSASLPAWQRDALRRLIVQGPLSPDDLAELAELCKAAHGLAEKRPSDPLQKKHIPTSDPNRNVVTLSSLTHHGGVNALAADQTVEFGPGLTVVYGDNAAGKSGYTRVLKRACRARGAEEILGNVLSGGAPGRPSATIRFKLGDKEDSLGWNDQEMSQHPLGSVSVFDSHCAAVYLREKTDVAFRPFALDLFDKLAKACEDVRAILDRERALLETPGELPKLSEGTAAFEFVTHLTSLTKPDDVKALGNFSDEETRRLGQLREQIKDLKSDDPQKTARALDLRAQRLDALASHLTKIAGALSDDAVASVFRVRAAVEEARDRVRDLQATTFPPELLPRSGSDRWRALWEAARRFSIEEAYPSRPFPVTEDDAKCLLCQQDLRDASPERLRRFEEFISSTLQRQLDGARAEYTTLEGALTALNVRDDTTGRMLEELGIEAEELATSIADALRQAEERRVRVLRTVSEGKPAPSDLPGMSFDPAGVAAEANALRQRSREILKSADKEAVERLSKELRELEDRLALGRSLSAVLEEIERKKKLAAHELCRRDTNTRAITTKSSEVTKAAVTQQLASSFQRELHSLRFTHLEVELQEAGGVRGALYHKLVLKRAAGVELPRVVSEGEARTLSIAAFFAELSTSSDRSAILFDDPVSSLDHMWRENVARRLIEEAKTRQVVVFTHDIAFLVSLSSSADENGASCKHQYLRRENLGAGMSSPDLPWIAMKLNDRLGVLRKNWQEAEKLFRTAPRDQYERHAKHIYGLLREAWERGLEEVLIGGVVERYRRSIQTQQAKHLCDITEEDCKAFDAGMTKSSRWLTGHDQAAVANAPVPEPAELKADIDALETWVQTIRRRRH